MPTMQGMPPAVTVPPLGPLPSKDVGVIGAPPAPGPKMPTMPTPAFMAPARGSQQLLPPSAASEFGRAVPFLVPASAWYQGCPWGMPQPTGGPVMWRPVLMPPSAAAVHPALSPAVFAQPGSSPPVESLEDRVARAQEAKEVQRCKIRECLEYSFSVQNLGHDRSFRQLMGEGGWIEAGTLAALPSLRALNASAGMVASAACGSTSLELSPSSTRVRLANAILRDVFPPERLLDEEAAAKELERAAEKTGGCSATPEEEDAADSSAVDEAPAGDCAEPEDGQPLEREAVADVADVVHIAGRSASEERRLREHARLQEALFGRVPSKKFTLAHGQGQRTFHDDEAKKRRPVSWSEAGRCNARIVQPLTKHQPARAAHF